MDGWQIAGLVLMVSGLVSLASAAAGYYYAEKTRERGSR